MKKKFLSRALCLIYLMAVLAGCSNGNNKEESKTLATDGVESQSEDEATADTEPGESEKEVEILLAAAASLEYCMKDELIPMFQENYPNINVSATYDSSGKLQTQIEQGADVDVFMSAAMKQMNELNEAEMMVSDSIIELLENKIVLIVPDDKSDTISSFEDLVDVDQVALGDPESVPVGQYAREALESLGIWDAVRARTSFGTNVTEVLNWIAEGSADAGIVYATDAATTEKVAVVAEAPEGSVSKIIYPIGVVSTSIKQEAAQKFVDFLNTDQAQAVFETYGFSANK